MSIHQRINTRLRTRFFCLLSAFMSSMLYIPASSAHHSFAIYDFDTQIKYTGVVESLKFKNPHISLTLKVTDDKGQEIILDFIEGSPANMLVRSGLKPAMINPGTTITVLGSPLREDPGKLFIRKIILQDGTEY